MFDPFTVGIQPRSKRLDARKEQPTHHLHQVLLSLWFSLQCAQKQIYIQIKSDFLYSLHIFNQIFVHSLIRGLQEKPVCVVLVLLDVAKLENIQ